MTDKTKPVNDGRYIAGWQPTLLGHAIRMYAHDALREAGIGDEHHSRHLVDLMRHAINEHGKDRAIEMIRAVWQPVRLGEHGNVPSLVAEEVVVDEVIADEVIADEPVEEPAPRRRGRPARIENDL